MCHCAQHLQCTGREESTELNIVDREILQKDSKKPSGGSSPPTENPSSARDCHRTGTIPGLQILEFDIDKQSVLCNRPPPSTKNRFIPFEFF